MPDYVLLADLDAKIPPHFIVQALDDNSDGVADAGIWDKILGSVSKEIDGVLGKRFRTPFSNPVPAFVLHAALVLASSALYERRGVADDENPFAKARDTIRTEMAAIAAGDAPLDPNSQRAQPSVSVIEEPARAQSSTNNLAV